MSRPGRLARTLRRHGVTGPGFTYTHDGTTYDDDTLSSVSITRGTGEPVGVCTSAATVVVDGVAPRTFDAESRVQLSDELAAALAAYTALTDVGAFQGRWRGRVAAQEVTDTGEKLNTQVTLADWLSVVPTDGTVTVSSSAPRAISPVNQLVLAAGLPSYASLVWKAGTDWPSYYLVGLSDPLTLNASDALDNLAKIGGHLGTRRDGSIYATEPSRLAADAAVWDQLVRNMPSGRPLTRRQCLSPARWVQPVTIPTQLELTQRRTDNPALTIGTVLGLYTGPRAGYYPQDSVDLTGFYNNGGGDIGNGARALFRRMSPDYTVPEVTVDLLYLLRPGSPEPDQAQLGYLLTRNLMDQVGLGNDWPPEVRGLHFITGMTETITRESWTLTLSLLPYIQVTGQVGPEVAGDTWDTAYPRETAWADVPPTDTWN